MTKATVGAACLFGHRDPCYPLFRGTITAMDTLAAPPQLTACFPDIGERTFYCRLDRNIGGEWWTCKAGLPSMFDDAILLIP